MSNVQIDTMQTSGVKTNFELEKLTPIALPEDQYDDASNNAKKSKQYLFNKIQTASPKIQSSYNVNQMTTKELLALYGSIPPSEQNELIKQIFENNPNRLNDVYQNLPNSAKNQFVMQELKTLSPIFIEMYNNSSEALKTQLSKEFLSQIASLLNSLPKDKKDEFVSNFKKSLNKTLKNDKSLSSSDKKEMKEDINKISFYLKGTTKNSDLLDVKSSGILNIMMIMVKAFCNSMDTESLDMLSQIGQISLDNMFLSKAEDQLVANNDTLAKLGNLAKRGWIFILVSVVVMAITIGSMFIGGEGAVADIGADTELDEGALKSSEKAPPEDDLKENEGKGSEEEVGKPAPKASPKSSTAQPLKEPTGGNPTKIEKGTSSDGNSQSTERAEQAKKGIRKKQIKTQQLAEEDVGKAKEKPGSFKTEVKRAWNEKPTKFIRNKFKLNGMRTLKWGAGGAFLCFNLYSFLKGVAPSAVNFKGSKDQPVDPVKLAQVQNTGAIESTVTDTLNNSIQNASKFMDNDSQKQNQYSGYVQQAINMLGQAYTGQ